MSRFVAIIALVFTIASIAGATTAHAHRYISMPLVVLNHVDSDNNPIKVVVTVQRGQIDLGAGIFLPCGSHQAIPVAAPTVPAAPERDRPVARLCPQSAAWIGMLPLRPPKSA